MKNTKQYSLILGAIGVSAIPILSLVSCGSSGGGITFSFPDLSSGTSIQLENADLSTLKQEGISQGLSQNDIDSITIQDVYDYQMGSENLNGGKKAILDKARKVLQDWAFQQTLNSTAMEGLQTWMNNAGLPVYSSQRLQRSPIRAENNNGEVKYYRSDIISPRYIDDFGPSVDLVGTTFKNALPSDKRVILTHNKYGELDQGDRGFDQQMTVGNEFVNADLSALHFSLYRSQGSGDYAYTTDSTTGEKTWTSEPTVSTNLFGALNVAVGDSQSTSAVGSASFDDLKTAIGNNQNADTLVFSTNGSVNYAKVQNQSIVDSGVAFVAKDLFFGLARQLYASKEFRTTGFLNGDDLNVQLPKMTTQELTTFNNLFASEEVANSYNNSNTYLYDLFGIDMPATIQANVANNNDNEFIMKFSELTPTSINIFKNSSLLSPFSNSLVSDTNNLNATSLQVSTYGNPYSGTGSANIDNILSLAPFLITNFTTSAGESRIIKQNPFYVDQSWVSSSNSVTGYETVITSDSADAAAFAEARHVSFLDAGNTREYFLASAVRSNPTLVEDLINYKMFVKPSLSGTSGNNVFSWNYYGFDNNSWNDLGREMMWGNGDVAQIKASSNAISSFFSGQGARLRDAIKASVNWYTMAQELYPGQNKEFYPVVPLEDEFTYSGVDLSFANPQYLQPNSELKNIYLNNQGNASLAWTPNTVANGAKTIDEIATQAGATAQNKAQIPIFTYIHKGITPPESWKNSNQIILKRLNALTPKVNFINQELLSWSDFITKANDLAIYPTMFGGASPDYPGVGSANQQALEKYSGSGYIGILKQAFAN